MERKEKYTTEELQELLQSNSIAQRAKALRFYEIYGELEHIDMLIDVAIQDSSLAIRSNAADSIGDILSRYRIAEKKELLTEEQRLAIVEKIRKIKISKTPSVYLAHAALGIPKSLQTLLSGFSDSRVEIQNCAAAALRCYCLSADVNGNQDLEAKIVGLIQDDLLNIPKIAHVVRLCAEAGYTSILPLLSSVSQEGILEETIIAAMEQFHKTMDRPVGIWRSNGLDALEFNPEKARHDMFLIVTPDAVYRCISNTWSVWEDFAMQPLRKLFYRKIGSDHPEEAIQVGQETWMKASTVDVEDFIQQETQIDLWDNKEVLLLATLVEHTKDSPKKWRNLSMLYSRGGEWDKAEAYANLAINSKKASNDVWFVRAKALARNGDIRAALEDVEQCLQLSKNPKSILHKKAEELQAELQIALKKKNKK